MDDDNEAGNEPEPIPVEFEGIGIAYVTPEALAAVLHHAKKLREAEGGDEITAKTQAVPE